MSAPGNEAAELAGAPLETLVRQEEIRLAPVSGSFDPAKVAAAIRSIGASFQDEADPSRFVLVPDQESRDLFQARRRTDPEAPFPYMPLIAVTPDELRIAPIANHPELRDLSMRFLQWLATTYDCRLITDEEDQPEE